MMTFLKHLPDSQAELTVTLEKNELVSFVNQTEKELAAELRVDGFRPGKAPKEFVKKELGENVLRQEAMELAVRASLAKAIRDEKLEVLDQLGLKVKENTADKLVFEAKFLVMPEIKLGHYTDLGIKAETVAVSDEEVGAVVEEIRKSRTVAKDVTRPVKKGDRVEVDFVIQDGGKEIEGGRSENHPLVVGEGKFVPGFEEQLVGMLAGEQKKFSLTIPADYYQKKIAGKLLDFEVTVKKVQEVSVPEADDKFAQSLGAFQSVSDMKANIKEGLTMEKTQKEKEKVRLAILKKISEGTSVKLPAILIEKQLEAMVADLDQNLHAKGMELGPYLAHLGKTQEELKKEWQGQAEEQVKHALVVRAVAKEEGIGVDDGEVEEEMGAALQQMMLRGGADGPVGPEAIQNIDTDALRERVRRTLLNEKIFEFLERNNTKG